MSVGVDRIIDLAKGAMLAAATYHAETQRQRYEEHRRAPAKGKRKWNPQADIAEVHLTFEDFFDMSLRAVRREVNADH